LIACALDCLRTRLLAQSRIISAHEVCGSAHGVLLRNSIDSAIENYFRTQSVWFCTQSVWFCTMKLCSACGSCAVDSNFCLRCMQCLRNRELFSPTECVVLHNEVVQVVISWFFPPQLETHTHKLLSMITNTTAVICSPSLLAANSETRARARL